MSMRLPKQVGEWINRDKKLASHLKAKNTQAMKETRLLALC